MPQVKLKSIALLTGGIFAVLFFHFVPVGLGNVTTVGKSNQETTAEIIEENTAIAKATKQGRFESEVKHANVRSMFAGSFDSSLCSSSSNFLYGRIKNRMVSTPKKAGNE